jgi:hypothetical protein
MLAKSRARGLRVPIHSIEMLEERRLFTTIVALERGKTLMAIDTVSLDEINAKVNISGLLKHETLTQIDFQASTGNLYGLSSTNRIYRINGTTGRATNVMIDGLPLDPAPVGTNVSLNMDDVEEVRIVSDSGFHATYSFNSSRLVQPGTLHLSLIYGVGDPAFGQVPDITGIANSGNFAGGTKTLFGIDRARSTVVRFGSFGGTPDSPNTGLLTTTGSLGVSWSNPTSFDIQTNPTTTVDTFYLSYSIDPRDRPFLYTTTETGGLTTLGQFGRRKREVTDFAVVPFGTPIIGTDNKVFQIFDSNLPNVPFFTSPRIVGLGHGEKIQFLAREPVSNQVFGMLNTRETYSADLNTGVLTRLGQLDTTLFNRKAVFSGDFDPSSGALRMFTNFGDNFRMTASGAVLGIDTPLNSATLPNFQRDFPTIFTPAFSHNIGGSMTSTLFAIDTRLNGLVTIGSPGITDSSSTGIVNQVLPFDFKIKSTLGFEINTNSTTLLDKAYFSFKGKGGSYLGSLDLGTLSVDDPLRFDSKFKIAAMTF